jgi:hypothetical protein
MGAANYTVMELRGWPLTDPQPSLRAALAQLDYDQGEKRLMLAVLTDAVGCIERYRSARGARCRKEYQAALRWVAAHDRVWPFSFENICQALDLDAVRLRTALNTPFLALLPLTTIRAGTFLPKVSAVLQPVRGSQLQP